MGKFEKELIFIYMFVIIKKIGQARGKDMNTFNINFVNSVKNFRVAVSKKPN